MKKFAITLCILGGLSVASGAYASIEEENMASVPFLRSDGHSEQMSKIADYVIYKHSNETAIPYYSQDAYADCDTNKLKWYTAIKGWFDPIQDDQLFGRHEITFTNSWSQNTPPLTFGEAKAKNKNVEPVAAEEVVEDVETEIQDAVNTDAAVEEKTELDSL